VASPPCLRNDKIERQRGEVVCNRHSYVARLRDPRSYRSPGLCRLAHQRLRHAERVDLAGSWSLLKFHENKTGTMGTLTNGTNNLALNFVGDFTKSDFHIVTGATTTVITHT
jgi:hypothetical protein